AASSESMSAKMSAGESDKSGLLSVVRVFPALRDPFQEGLFLAVERGDSGGGYLVEQAVDLAGFPAVTVIGPPGLRRGFVPLLTGCAAPGLPGTYRHLG